MTHQNNDRWICINIDPYFLNGKCICFSFDFNYCAFSGGFFCLHVGTYSDPKKYKGFPFGEIVLNDCETFMNNSCLRWTELGTDYTGKKKFSTINL